MHKFWRHIARNEGIKQKTIVAPLAVTMHLNQALSTAAERAGVTSRVKIFRKSTDLMNILRDPREDIGLEITNTTIDGVQVRITRPHNNPYLLPAIIHFHGGAFYMGSVDTHNTLTSILARHANVVVVSVNFRLAPQHPFPAGLEDCDRVARHILQYGDSPQLCIDPQRVALAGDSSGGNFAAVLSMRYATNRTTRYLPHLQVLIYPLLQFFDFTFPSCQEDHYEVYPYAVEYLLSLYINQSIDKSIYQNNHTSIAQKRYYRRFVDWNLLPDTFRRTYRSPMTDNHEGEPGLVHRAYPALHPDISPLLAEDSQLAKLPPTYVLTVGHDRLRDEGFIYVNRLLRCGVPVVHHHYKDAFHASITNLYGLTKLEIAHQMVANIVDYLRYNL